MNKEQVKENQTNNMVKIVDQKGVEHGLSIIIKKNIALLPDSAMIERIKNSASFYISNREDLMKLDNEGKLRTLYGVMKEAMVGCEAGTDYDIVPFKGQPTIIRKKEGWFKVIDLVKPAEVIKFTTNVITGEDEYVFNPVTEELHHEMIGERSQNYEDIKGAYCYIKFANGFEKTIFMSRTDIDLIKNISPSGKSEHSPWNKMPIKMVKTKVTKELAKELFTLFSGRVNSALARAIESDEIPVKEIDDKGNIINDEAIYTEVEETKEVVEEEKKVKLSDLQDNK